MNIKLPLRIAAVVVLTIFLSSTARAQVLIETGRILSPKTKDLGEIIDKAAKGPKEAGAAQPRVETPSPRSRSSASAQPHSVLDPFSSDTEDPASILEINVDVLTRFSAALAAESARRGDAQNPLTREKYNAVGAEAGGFTPRQYFVLKARATPFCEAIAARQAPPDDLRFSYLPTEAMALKPRCAALLPGLRLTLPQ
jgi:hypothetical protein